MHIVAMFDNISQYKYTSLWSRIMNAPWVEPPTNDWAKRGGDQRHPPKQPLVDLVEEALDEWPLEAVDACLDEYFDGRAVYDWEVEQSKNYKNGRGYRRLPLQPRSWLAEEP